LQWLAYRGHEQFCVELEIFALTYIYSGGHRRRIDDGAETFRATTLTILSGQTVASSSMNRVDDTSGATARSCAGSLAVVTSISEVVLDIRLGRIQE